MSRQYIIEFGIPKSDIKSRTEVLSILGETARRINTLPNMSVYIPIPTPVVRGSPLVFVGCRVEATITAENFSREKVLNKLMNKYEEARNNIKTRSVAEK